MVEEISLLVCVNFWNELIRVFQFPAMGLDFFLCEEWKGKMNEGKKKGGERGRKGEGQCCQLDSI